MHEPDAICQPPGGDFLSRLRGRIDSERGKDCAAVSSRQLHGGYRSDRTYVSYGTYL